MSDSTLWRCLLVFVAVLSLKHPVAAIDDSPKAATAPAEDAQAPPGPDQIAQLIKDLDANKFAVREAASQRLAAAGKSAVPELAKTAVGESVEAAMRAIAILRRHLADGDPATRSAAREALEKIAKSDQPAAASAAAEALRTVPRNQRTTPVPGGVQIEGRFNLPAGGMRTQTFSTRGANGVKEYNVREDNRSIKIIDDPQNGITLEVTEKKDGKDETKKYEAKNSNELKTKHPEAFRLYEETTKQPLGPQVFAGPQPFERMRMPGLVLPRSLLALFGREFGDQLDRADQQIDEATKLIQKHLTEPGKPDDLRKALEQLEEAQKKLNEVRARLRE